MNKDPQAIKSARRSRLSSQMRLLHAVDERGHRKWNEAGEQYLDLGRIPVVLRNIGVPPALSEATFATSEFARVDEVRQWFQHTLDSKVTDQDVDHLVVLVGAGSNYIAAAALRNAVKWNKTVAWYSWHDFV